VVFISMHQVNLPFLLLLNFTKATFILFHLSYCHLPPVLFSTC
jgi:hypothetical protein